MKIIKSITVSSNNQQPLIKIKMSPDRKFQEKFFEGIIHQNELGIVNNSTVLT